MDYGRFKYMKGNRAVNPNKVNRIVNSVKDKADMLKYNPVIVTSRYEVLDGQHRLEASKELQRPVYFMIAPLADVQTVATLNSNTDSWSMKNFLTCYRELGNKHYEKLAKFMEEYDLDLSTSMHLLYEGKAKTFNSPARTIFRDGKFEIRREKIARGIAELYSDLAEFHDGKPSRSFAEAVDTLYYSDVYDHPAMRDRLRHYSLTIERQPTRKLYLQELQRLFNHRQQKNKPIY